MKSINFYFIISCKKHWPCSKKTGLLNTQSLKIQKQKKTTISMRQELHTKNNAA